jgi:sugar O-acyltransferase (sialic acid O-acetyltransferase NeuD family)
MSGSLKSIVILGSGGYAQELAWILDDLNTSVPEWNFLGFVDPTDPGKQEHYGHPVLGGYETVSGRFDQIFFACGIGAPAVRRKECQRAEEMGWLAVSLIHPSVIRARFVSIGDGSIIGPGSVIGPYVRIGRHCAVNVQTTIGHNASVGDFSVISPGARILGNVILEEQVFVGANASVYPKRRIGAGATLGANSFLLHNLAAGQSALGVPARAFCPRSSSNGDAPATPHRAVSSLNSPGHP